MKKVFFIKVLLLFSVIAIANDSIKPGPVTNRKIELFPLQDIRLNEGRFKHIQDLEHTYLLSLQPDRMLSWFRREAGLTPKANPYPGWESVTAPNRSPLSGHILGFYLSSMSMMYASTNDEKIMGRLKYTLEELRICQQANANGYLLPTINGKQLFQDVAEGNFKTSNPFINSTKYNTSYDYWEPVYVLNKMMLGLYSVYTNCHLPLAKKILIDAADWFGEDILDKLSHEQIQKLLVCEHGSINESYIQVYQLTGRQKYLDWAKKLNDEDMWIPASQGKDILNGWHANTQIPKFTGFESVYNYTGDKKLHDAAQFFWHTVVKNRSWVIGGNSTAEHFFPKDEFDAHVLSAGGPESCNSVNMMRLTEILYQDAASPDMVDYYEKVLYNHILANYNPENGMCVYYTSMRPGHYKVYSSLYDSFWCCTGTGMEAPAKFGQMIYAHQNDALYINMFMASALNWADKNVSIIQKTRFPDNGSSEINIETKTPAEFTLKIRQPEWLAAPSVIKINGKTERFSKDTDGYISIRRVWKNADRVSVSLPRKLTNEALSNSHKYLAFKYGPTVLAAKVDNHGLTKEDFTGTSNSYATQTIPVAYAPAFAGNLEKIKSGFKKNKVGELSFTAKTAAGENIEMVPFNRISFSRYAVYFPHFDSASQYQSEIKLLKDKISGNSQLEKQTIDRVLPGDEKSEQEHSMEAVFSYTGGASGASWRDARNGGYFMYNLKILPDKPQSLYMVYSSNDEGARVFDVVIDGKVLQTVDHSKKIAGKNGELYPLIINLPLTATAGKSTITVKFHAKRGNTAGGLFDLRIIEAPED